ncbi:glycosyltransferase family 2 protein [Streptomyces sp. NPDC000594]|uniref:glycosyltransferase family 2 protein n=1 Tax=Streptomyces sp. NPDC000594 TaxID=3154261 RepID=UPI003323B1CF
MTDDRPRTDNGPRTAAVEAATPGGPAPGGPVPDVTVVLAVYNTLPYLLPCLESLAAQTIGLRPDTLRIVAVDDGSTDGSGVELDRFAARHPDAVTVVHQPNSGGPGAPSNRGLALATGRYVHFVGADDRLAPDALARLVAHADEHGSDIVIGRMTGVGGRYVHQALFRRSALDVRFADSALPFTLSNAKLFRRELLERHRLRFPEDLPVGSDQPFTIAACVHARRISVLADSPYYYAVRRADAGNITYTSGHPDRLRCTARIMHEAAGLIGPGPERDSLLRRHFTWELAKLLKADFPALPAPVRREVCAGIAALADSYLTPPLRDSLPVAHRARITLAQYGAVDTLVRAIEDEERRGAVFAAEGGRAFLRCPGFRDPALALPDRAFELLDEYPATRLAAGTRLLAAGWRQDGDDLALTVAVRLPVTGSVTAVVLLLADPFPAAADGAGGRRLPAREPVPPAPGTFRYEDAPGTFRYEDVPGGHGTVLHATVPVPVPAGAVSLAVRVRLRLAGAEYEIPVRVRGTPLPLARRWRLTESRRAAVRVGGKDRMVLVTGPMFPPEPPPPLTRLRRRAARVLRRPRARARAGTRPRTDTWTDARTDARTDDRGE